MEFLLSLILDICFCLYDFDDRPRVRNITVGCGVFVILTIFVIWLVAR